MLPDPLVAKAATKQFDEGAAADSVQARARRSPFGGGVDAVSGTIFNLALPQTPGDDWPPWGYYPHQRDAFLRRYWKSEPMFAGAVYSLQARMRALAYEINDDKPRWKQHFQNVLGMADLGAGFPSLVGKTTIDLLTQDNGAFWELIGPGSPAGKRFGPPTGIAHLDSQRCFRTFDPEFPVLYLNADDNQYRKMHYTRVVRMASMPQPNEMARGIGFSALSRALIAVRTMKIIQRYKDEKISGNLRGLIYGKGFSTGQMKTALTMSDNDDEAAGVFFYKGIPVILQPDVEGDVTMDILSLSSLPDGFDFQDETTMYIYAIALCFGVDAREFWPATAAGATKADAAIQHLKARGKGIGDLIQTVEHPMNWQVLPDGVTFGFDFQDDEQDMMAAELHAKESEIILNNKREGIITAQEARDLQIAKGILDGKVIGSTAPEPADEAGTMDSDVANTQAPDQEKPNEEEEKARPPVPFDQAAQLAKAQKDFAATAAAFTSDVALLIEQLGNSDITRIKFSNTMRALVKRAGYVAFLDGLEAGGVEVDELVDDDLATYNAWVAEQSQYISNLGADLAERESITSEWAQYHASMWLNKTLSPMFQAGELSANGNEMVIWVLGPTEHCKDCLRLAGQKHRRKTWHRRGLVPQSSKLACGGYGCQCKFERTTGRAAGRF